VFGRICHLRIPSLYFLQPMGLITKRRYDGEIYTSGWTPIVAQPVLAFETVGAIRLWRSPKPAG
jgi:hypothetical protein